MAKLHTVVAVFAILAGLLPAESYRFGHVWDGERMLTNAVIVIENGRIKSVGALTGGDGIDLSRYTALPGLIDVHTHMTFLPRSLPAKLTDAGRADPVMRSLPPRLWVLQWHGEYFHDIRGATALASSLRYPLQAFRVANAYGLLFHLEATLHSVAAMCGAFPDDLRRGPLSTESLLEEARDRLAGVQRYAQAVLGGLLAIR